MQFADFTLFPAPNRSVPVDDQRRIGKMLEEMRIVEHLPKTSELLIEIHDRVTGDDVSLVRAHGEWTETYFPGLKTPDGLPRQDADATCPPGLLKITASCIKKRSGGMGSQFGFIGLFVSMLISLDDNLIWDARCEQAT